MRVLITADPFLPVPPAGYGGIERVVALLVDGLVARGHDVTLAARPDSRVRGRLAPYGSPDSTTTSARRRDLARLSAIVWAHRRDVDVVHSFGRLAALLPVLPLRRLPKVQSYQRAVPLRSAQHASRLAGDSLLFAACATHMYEAAPASMQSRWRTVFNAVDTEFLPFAARVAADAPLVFLGRLEPIKGVHHAIAIAAAAGRRLVIAGNRVDTPEGARYFATRVEPFIDDRRVVYVGEVGDAWKAQHLPAAAALLMPVEWDEPFGLVMAEALACGTPIVGFHRGAVPEVVRHGCTGFVCRDAAEAVAAVRQIDAIDRAACRADAEARFSPAALVRAYERIYAELQA